MIPIVLLKPFPDIIWSIIATVGVILAFNLSKKDLSDAFSSHLCVLATSEVVPCNSSDECRCVDRCSILHKVALSIGADVLLQLIEEILGVAIELTQFASNLLSNFNVILSQIDVLIVFIVRVEDFLSDSFC